jgi:hypothetical protein
MLRDEQMQLAERGAFNSPHSYIEPHAARRRAVVAIRKRRVRSAATIVPGISSGIEVKLLN